MNAGPDTHSVHLDLEDLIAEAAGQPVAARASEHLAHCADCRAEADRWIVVADGIRGVPSATPETGWPARRQPTRPRVLARAGRRTALAVGAAAAAVVLIGVAGYETGAVHIRFGQASGASGASGTILTAVGGCTGLEEATGTLEQINGGSLVIKTASGQPVTLTTTASTFAVISGALLGDIRDGAPVRVTGPSSDGTIAALLVATTPGSNLPQTHPSIPGSVTVQGTVVDTTTAGFTVVTSSGTRVPVTTSDSTTVTVLNVSPGQFQPGAMTLALGNAGPDGTLSARAVVQPMIGVVSGPPGAPGAQRHASVSVSSKGAGGCSPTSLAAGTLGSAG